MYSLQKWALLAILVLLPACGPKGFSTLSESENGSNKTNGQNKSPPLPSSTELKGFVDNGTFENKQVLGIDPVAGEVLLSVPLGFNVLIDLPETPIEKLPGAKMYSATADDGSRSLVLSIPLKYVLRGASQIPSGKLPNGESLPNMPAGEMPFIGLSFPGQDNYRIFLYVGMDAVGVFVETKFNPTIRVGVRILNRNQRQIGNLYMIPALNGARGGFFLGIVLPSALARVLDQFVR